MRVLSMDDVSITLRVLRSAKQLASYNKAFGTILRTMAQDSQSDDGAGAGAPDGTPAEVTAADMLNGAPTPLLPRPPRTAAVAPNHACASFARTAACALLCCRMYAVTSACVPASLVWLVWLSRDGPYPSSSRRRACIQSHTRRRCAAHAGVLPWPSVDCVRSDIQRPFCGTLANAVTPAIHPSCRCAGLHFAAWSVSAWYTPATAGLQSDMGVSCSKEGGGFGNACNPAATALRRNLQHAGGAVVAPAAAAARGAPRCAAAAACVTTQLRAVPSKRHTLE